MLKRLVREQVPAALAAIVALAIAAPSAADLTVTVKDGDEEQMVYITSDKLAMESDKGSVVFDAKAETMRMRDPQGNAHTMTRKDLEDLAAMSKQAPEMPEMNEMMAQARKQAEEAIAELPAEQQEEARKALDRSLPGGGKSAKKSMARTYEPMNKTQEINGHECKGYSILEGDEAVGETWVASLDELDIKASDLAVIAKLREFFGSALAGSPAAESMAGLERMDPQSDHFIGVPVRTVKKGKVTELVGIKKGKIDAKVFQEIEE